MDLNATTLHLVTTLAMAGVILFVQVVHYPLMDRVGQEVFVRYERDHTRKTAYVVVPLMCVELATAVWLVFGESDRLLSILGLALLAVIWGSTFALQAPTHSRLLRGFDAAAHRALVRTNWIRTAAWLARVPIAVSLAL